MFSYKRLSYKQMTWIGVSLAAMGALSLASHRQEADANRHRRSFQYEVTITNMTRGQIFSPAVLYTHTDRMRPLFVAGQPASEELAALAEDAVLDPLIDSLEESDNVRGVVVVTGENGPILPGETVTATIDASFRASLVSLAGMLVTTNDAFYALNGGRRASTYNLNAYDAGSEANNELCSHIPGPPCGSAGVRDTEGAEGYVHIHAGVHGVGDLDPAQHDWRNSVARVEVRRVVTRH